MLREPGASSSVLGGDRQQVSVFVGLPPQDLFAFARCKAPLPISLLQKTGVPQPAELVEVVEKNVEWEEFQVRMGWEAEG